MLTGSVYTCERLLVKKAGESVAARNLFHSLHDELVVINCDICGFIDGRKLMLRGRNLVVLGLCRNTELPEFDVEVFHIRTDSLTDCSKIVVLKLLSLGCGSTEKSSSRKDKVRSL